MHKVAMVLQNLSVDSAYLIVPVGETQGLWKLASCCSGMFIFSGGIGFRLGGLGIQTSGGGAHGATFTVVVVVVVVDVAGLDETFISSGGSAWNTILIFVLGKRSTHLKWINETIQEPVLTSDYMGDLMLTVDLERLKVIRQVIL
jgi:hypothetical protein